MARAPWRTREMAILARRQPRPVVFFSRARYQRLDCLWPQPIDNRTWSSDVRCGLPFTTEISEQLRQRQRLGSGGVTVMTSW